VCPGNPRCCPSTKKRSNLRTFGLCQRYYQKHVMYSVCFNLYRCHIFTSTSKTLIPSNFLKSCHKNHAGKIRLFNALVSWFTRPFFIEGRLSNISREAFFRFLSNVSHCRNSAKPVPRPAVPRKVRNDAPPFPELRL